MKSYIILFCTLLFGLESYSQTISPPGPINFCSGDSVVLTAPSGTNYHWYNNATLIAGATLGTYTAKATGNYTVSYTDSTGQQDITAAVVVTVNTPNTLLSGTPPLIVFNNENYFDACIEPPATSSIFKFTYTATANSTETLIWGDNSNPSSYNTSNNFTVNHTYAQGNYQDTFIVSSGGCTDTAYYNIFVGSNPGGSISNPSNTEGCTGETFSFPFANVANNPIGTIYHISVDDGTPSVTYSQQNLPADFTHTFNSASCNANGNNYFTVSYTISNPCGSTSGTISGIGISAKPIPTFQFSPQAITCVNSIDTLVNTSKQIADVNGEGGCLLGEVVWEVTPTLPPSAIVSGSLGSVNGSANPNLWTTGSNNVGINYPDTGIYTVTLKEGGNPACGTDSTTKTICVNPLPTASFTLSSTNGCAPLQSAATTTTNAPTCGQYTYNWTITNTTVGCEPVANSVTYLNNTSSTSAQPVFLFNSPGVYTITLVVFAPDMACSSTPVQEQVTVLGIPNIPSLNIPTSVCQMQPISPTAVDSCAVNTNTTYSWSFPGGTPSKSDLEDPGKVWYTNPGKFTISLSAINTCGPATISEPLTVNPVPLISIASANNPTICDSATGSIVLDGLAPTTSYTVIYNGPPDGLPDTATIFSVANGSLTIPGLAIGTYSNINVITPQGCSSNTIGPVNLANPDPPARPTASTNSPVCAGSTLRLYCDTVPGAIYAWSGPDSFSTSLQNPILTNDSVLNSGIYYVTITVNNCVSSPGSIRAVVNANAAVPTVTANTPVCNGDILDLVANSVPVSSDPVTYQWTGPCITPSDSTFAKPSFNTTLACTGNYCVTAFNAGCPAPSPTCVSVQVDANPVIDSTSYLNPTACGTNTGSITLYGLVPGVAYNLQYDLNNKTQPVDSSDFPNEAGEIIINYLAAGTYSNIKVTTPDGCHSNLVGPITLTNLLLPTPTLTSNSPVCVGGTLNLACFVAPAAGKVSYAWAGPGITPANDSMQNPVITGTTLEDGGTYTVVTATENGCGSTGTINVVINSPSVGGHTFNPATVCYGTNTGTIQLTGNNGGVTNWESSTDGGVSWLTINDTTASLVFNNLVNTTWYRAVLQNGACDTANSDITVITVINSVPVPTIGANQTICNQQSAVLSASSPVIGTGAWSQLLPVSPLASITDPTDPSTSVSNLTNTTYTFLWTVTGPLGCGSSSAQLQIIDRPAITQADAGPEQDICDFTTSRSITLAGNIDASRPFEQGLWTILSEPSDGNGTFSPPNDPNATFSFNQTGNYNLQWTISDIDSVCAPSSSSIIVKVSNPPVASFTVSPTQICVGDAVSVTNNSSNANVYNWYWGDGQSTTFTSGQHTYGSSGSEIITLIAENLESSATCMDSTKETVNVLPLPSTQINVTPSSLVQYQPDYTFTFQAVSADSTNMTYLWNLGDHSMQTRTGTEVSYAYTDTGSYVVNLLSTDFSSGCYSNDSVTVKIIYVPGYLQIPDAFCPGCSENELRTFLPLGKGLSSYHLTISTIWGKVIFETTALAADGSPSEAWNGQYNGQAVLQDSYRWQIEARYINGTEWEGMLYPKTGKRVKSGFLTVIK